MAEVLAVSKADNFDHAMDASPSMTRVKGKAFKTCLSILPKFEF